MGPSPRVDVNHMKEADASELDIPYQLVCSLDKRHLAQARRKPLLRPTSIRMCGRESYSFATKVPIEIFLALSFVLQIDPGELKVGVRPVRRTPSRIHGEVFLYDDVPGGAGYARAIEQNLGEILQKALDLGEHCLNPNCAGACYHCMYDYRNQMLH